KLAPKKQPSVLTTWLDGPHSFDNAFNISDIDHFGNAMVEWWNALQPSWRQSNEGLPIPQYTGTFTSLCKGGQNGIITVLFGLFWWGRNLVGNTSQWHKMVADVSDMLDALLCAKESEKQHKQ
ncbi:hypothetical protein EV421DRAFT_1723608, partial [Armillaria borealis]